MPLTFQEEENSKLAAKIKELEEDRVRLQRTINIHQTQTEKQKALAEELARKCDDLQLQVSALNKEVETLTRSQKQAAFIHSTMEVRLNRAVEEAERLKSQLAKTKQMNKMHFEAAKLLSFAEEEFMKALDWGKS
uniref:Testis expressed 9 n=1 Tax=Poecilia reticulata TaxID=8081 RepID=A0A3P9QJK9_POERE